MIKDAIVLAAPHLKIRGKSLLECLDDMESYTLLTDGILHKVKQNIVRFEYDNNN